MTPLFHVRDIPRRRFLELGLKGGLALAAAPAWLKDLGAAQGPGSGAAAAVDPGLLAKALAKGLAKGGDFAEVYLEKRISRSILLEEGRFKSAVFGLSQGAGVRGLSGDKTGYAYTDEPTEAKILRAAETASAIARSGGSTAPAGATSSPGRSAPAGTSRRGPPPGRSAWRTPLRSSAATSATRCRTASECRPPRSNRTPRCPGARP